jgi:hypothetical protein
MLEESDGREIRGRGDKGTDGQCVGEMIFCVHEPQYAAQDPSFGYNI